MHSVDLPCCLSELGIAYHADAGITQEGATAPQILGAETLF